MKRARAVAANFGLQHARGGLALFLDDDDVLLPHHIANLQAALRAAPDAPAAFADTDFGYFGPQGWHSLHRFEGGFDAVRLRFENFLPIHSVLFRHGPDTPRVDPAFDLFEDWDFWLQMAQRGDFVHVSGIGARYVAAEGQRSGVFVDSPATRQARAQLFKKWQGASSAQDHQRLLEHLQRLYREHAQGQDTLRAASAAQAYQQEVIEARQGELDAASQQLQGLRDMLAARDAELSAFAQQLGSLKELVRAREAQTEQATLHAQSLADLVAARDAMLLEAQQHAQTLTAARETESAAAVRHAEGLMAVVAAREAELTEAGRHARGLAAALQAREAELTQAAGHIQRMVDQLAHRDREVAEATAYAKDLLQHLQVRTQEVHSAELERQSLLQLVAAREQELAAWRSRSQALEATLDTLKGEHEQLLAQAPLRAAWNAYQRRRRGRPDPV
jgi:ABC-type transporter Mla subunit MlaD